MPTKITMPKLGESVVEGTINKRLVQEGDKVQQYDPILEITTDKVDTEIPCSTSGTILKLLVSEGDTVKVGVLLGWIGEPGKGRALGVNSVKFTGEVLTNTKIARYKVDMKRLMKRQGSVVGLANGILYADDKLIYEAESLKVGLYK